MLITTILLSNLLFILGFWLWLPESLWMFTLHSAITIGWLVYLLRKVDYHYKQTISTLSQGLRNLHDGDFAISLAPPKSLKSDTEYGQLITLFNQVTEKLRDEKQSLYQRELLLDKVVNVSDVVTVLINHRDTIIFANRAAQHFFHSSALLGDLWTPLITNKIPCFLAHKDKNNAIIQLLVKDNSTLNENDEDQSEGIEQSWHLSRHQLKLNGAAHQLVLLKPLTAELRKQELQTWKKVIRVINHELNNSIAPISSMCHSGMILAEKVNEPQLNQVFDTISGRIKRLSAFIHNYSQLARLSAPIYQRFNIVATLEQLQHLYQFELSCPATDISIAADASQIEQLLINILKNAKEHAPEQASHVTVEQQPSDLRIVVRDFGSGMQSTTMQKAFLPYYSTKTNGSGIGLSICRDVVDAHHGQITLSNHSQGGLVVDISLPLHYKN